MKKTLIRILAALAFFAAAFGLEHLVTLSGWFSHLPTVLALMAYALAGYDVLLSAVRNILRGQVFDENFLMAIATVGALALGEFLEAAAVMIFYQVGELFQDYAVGQSRKSIAQLMDIKPDTANVRRGGELVVVDPYDVAVGDIIVIKPGERVPLDAVILSGRTALDTSALTGESMPRDAAPGDEILSGCINQSGLVEARVIREFGESTVSRILDMVENASSKKSVTERFITRFARYYTPAVVAAAVLLALVPPLLLGQPFRDWASRALIFLVVSCPCALVISIPLSFFGGIGGASRRGILVKGSNYLDALARTDTVVFDKTGTLTRGVFSVREVRPASGTEAALIELAALCESYSDHPISLSLRRAYGAGIDAARVKDAKEIAGHGVSALVDGTEVLCGNDKMMQSHGVTFTPIQDDSGTVVYVAADGVYQGAVVIADTLKQGARPAVQGLKAVGVSRTVMLTGDAEGPGRSVARELGISEAYTGLLPQDKVEKVEHLLQDKPRRATLCFVGDGINDAPVLARADVGVAMGALGSDAAIEAADLVIMDDNPQKLVTAIRIARKTVGIAGQNIVFALAVKGLVLVLAALGYSQMWHAIFADVGVAVIAILNALRALNTEKL